MRFTDGFWLLRPGVTASYAQQAYRVTESEGRIEILAPTKVVKSRGDTLNLPVLSVELSSPLEGVVRVRVDHHLGRGRDPGFDLPGANPDVGRVAVDGAGHVLESGDLRARVDTEAPWALTFSARGQDLVASPERSVAMLAVTLGSDIGPWPTEKTLARRASRLADTTFIAQRLTLRVGEVIYGLGERFGPFAKNGQSIDIWNADAGTSSEQAYKNVPFYLSSRGYGVLVNHAGLVSFEVGSEQVERVQFSVEGEGLEYFVIDGPTPKDVLERLTRLTGRPGVVPPWSYGPWLSTSFTTPYDEQTVTEFLDGMAERDLPVSVFHFDTFWMRELQWVDLVWDVAQFPDPKGMIERLHSRGLRVSVWINPYVAQASPLFAEGMEEGYFLRRGDGSVWQWDLWQPGMAILDVTNPRAVEWFQGRLRALLDMGVDTFKTDFGERIPLDVEYHDGSDPEAMHNLYALRYNEAVHEVLVQRRGPDDAVVFARSATVGSQRIPVHWGGDSDSSYESMAETLRGGLSLSMSGFAHWSHDIGGFEGTPDPGVFKRWTAFGLLSSHSRFHGSDSYRVPWAFDEEAVEIARKFIHLKLRLMPYLWRAGIEATETGVPVMRSMVLEFPTDPATTHLDRQYMLGPDLLIAPVFDAHGIVDFYLPAGRWTSLLTGDVAIGPVWRRETHGFDSLPVYVREGAVIPWGSRDDVADYDYLSGLTLLAFPGRTSGEGSLRVLSATGDEVRFRLEHAPERMRISAEGRSDWVARVFGGNPIHPVDGVVELQSPASVDDRGDDR